MIAQTDYQDTSLIRPPVKPKVEPQAVIPGSSPPLGAGSAIPLPPPPGDGMTPTLPFGNGAALAGSAVGSSPTGETLQAILSRLGGTRTNPTMDPSVDPSAPWNPGAPAAGSADLGNTMIAAQPGAAPLSSAAEQWRAKFGAEMAPTDIQAGAIGGPRISKYDSMTDSAADALQNTDRRSMLSSLLSDFDTQQSEADAGMYKRSGEKSAAMGRIGSGMAAQDINQITRQSMRDRNIFRNQLAQDTIGKEIGDRFDKAGLFSKLGDTAYGRASDDRSFNYGVGRDNQNARTAAQEAAFRFGNDRAALDYGQGMDARSELRGERSYQDQRSDKALTDRERAAELQDRLTDSAFNRADRRLTAGSAGNPSSTYGVAAGDYSQQSGATQAALMEFLKSLGIGS